MKSAIVLLLSCASLGYAQTAAAPAQPLKNCEDARIRYMPMDEQYSDRMVVQATSEARPQGDPRMSPQRTRWIMMSSPDYSKPGPWTTTIWIGEGDDETTLKLTLRNHEGFNVEWLNEKLIYGSVAWDKVLSTDFIFDVENKKFIYRETENSSELSEPCE